LLRLFLALTPTLLLLTLIVVPVVLYVAYTKGMIFQPKTLMITNPASGNLTRIEIEDVKEVSVDNDTESTLTFRDGTHMTIKTKDANRLIKWLPTMN
jgi:hypothetical protein